MKKKYLKTVEDVLAFKDTDTKIYAEKDEGCYYQFVKGVLCCFSTNNNHVCIGDWVTLKMNLYILEEEPEQEASEATKEDVGKLCKFWDNETRYVYRILYKIYVDNEYPFVDETEENWKHCRRLIPSEVEELTGYKVEEK